MWRNSGKLCKDIGVKAIIGEKTVVCSGLRVVEVEMCVKSWSNCVIERTMNWEQVGPSAPVPRSVVQYRGITDIKAKAQLPPNIFPERSGSGIDP